MEKNNAQRTNEEAAQQISLEELKQLILTMQPSGKINDIHAIRLFLLAIVSKLEESNKI